MWCHMNTERSDYVGMIRGLMRGRREADVAAASIFSFRGIPLRVETR